MRRSLAVHPKLFIETDSIDDERVAFPVANGMAVITGFEILRMLSPVHIDHSHGMRAANVHDVDALQFRHIDELDAIRREKLSSASGRFTTSVGLELILEAIVVDPFCPRLPRYLANFGFWGSTRNGSVEGGERSGVSATRSTAAFFRFRKAGIPRQPDSQLSWKWSEIWPPVRPTRSGTRRSSSLTTAAALPLSLQRRKIRQGKERLSGNHNN